jgi:AraC family transcriptional regulator
MPPDNKILADDYTSRINRVIDHIENNLDTQFTLDELALISHFSKFHFSRIFWGMTGETPFEFITRIRLEKAASMLRMYPHEPVLQIAMKCGYSDKSVFSRNFKSYFGTPPSAYRKSNSNNHQLLSNNSQQSRQASEYFCDESQTKRRSVMEPKQQVEVKNLPAITVAYVRHTGPYQGNGELFERLFNKLFAWAGPRGLIQPNTRSFAVYHDDPSVTDPQKLRLSICLEVPPDTPVDGEIGKMELEAGKYAMARYEIQPQDFPAAWQWLFGTWFPASGYQPDDKLPFEIYYGQPKNGMLTVDICVPVKPM